MKRRDTERHHLFATKVFGELGIFDIQGVLKEGEVFKCGIEAYQVFRFSEIDWGKVDQQGEISRVRFCEFLKIPYYVVIRSEAEYRYKIFNISIQSSKIVRILKQDLSVPQFLDWWRSNQSFDQRKSMYEASSRIVNSLIDSDLFSNHLAWGINVDGFMLDKSSQKVLAIFEKRIRTYKYGQYSVENYDPNAFFHGTQNRAGDFTSWSILFELSLRLNARLVLLTFDTSEREKVGASIVKNVSKEGGLVYKNGLKPCNNLFESFIGPLRDWIYGNL